MLPTERTPAKTNFADMAVLVYGPSKIGKSTFCSQSEGALFLATEPGLNALNVYQVPIDSWKSLLAISGEIAKGNHSFKTIILDTVDNAYRFCCEHICQEHDIAHESDLGYGKGWALINNEFNRVLTKLAFLSCGFFLVSHSQTKEFETRTGKHMRTVPTLPEKPRQIVLGLVDIILFCDIEVEQDAEGNATFRRVIRTKPSPNYDAGDRTGRLPETIDLGFGNFLEAFEAKEKATAAKASS